MNKLLVFVFASVVCGSASAQLVDSCIGMFPYFVPSMLPEGKKELLVSDIRRFEVVPEGEGSGQRIGENIKLGVRYLHGKDGPVLNVIVYANNELVYQFKKFRQPSFSPLPADAEPLPEGWRIIRRISIDQPEPSIRRQNLASLSTVVHGKTPEFDLAKIDPMKENRMIMITLDFHVDENNELQKVTAIIR